MVGAITNAMGLGLVGFKVGELKFDNLAVATVLGFAGMVAGVASNAVCLQLAANASSWPMACLWMLPSAAVGGLSWAYVSQPD
ncbi:MAG: hypothetical protein AB1758_05570 [Candidatus Eremiobacterota bacterium]